MYILRIKLGAFSPNYDTTKSYGYSGIKGDNLKELLYSTSNGYCMYCFSKVNVDSKRLGHLEHSIEKRHNDKLIECVPNISLACPKCNLSFKKVGDKGDIFTSKQLTKFVSGDCTGEKCTKECPQYLILKRHYLKKRNIILQPSGVKRNNKEYLIQYNLLTLEFEPDSDINYSDDEKKYILSHIERFNLNDSVYRTRELLNFCKDVINGDTYLRKGKYSNFIVDLFMKEIEGLSNDERLKLCRTIYTIGVLKRII